MPTDLKQQRQAIIDDLKFLVAELEQNPQVAPWVINQALRSVKHKAAIWGAETAAQKAGLERLIHLNSSIHGS